MAPQRPPFARLRRALLVVFLLLIGGLVTLYLFGRQRPSDEAPAVEQLLTKEGVTTSGEGFEFTQELEGRPVFRLEGERFQVDQEDRVTLEGVHLALFREDGGAYQIASRWAVYQRDRRAARLSGNVLLAGPRDLRLETAELELAEGGQRLASTGPVRFASGDDLVGNALGLEVDLERELYILRGDVRIESTPEAERPFSLQAQRLLYERKRRLVRAEGGVEVSADLGKLITERVSLLLTEDERDPQFLSARWGVAGEVATSEGSEGTTQIRFHGRELAVHFEPATSRPERMELTGTLSQLASLASEADSGVMRWLSARNLTATFQAGVLQTATAFLSVRSAEFLGLQEPKLVREAKANQAEARFGADGKLEGLTLNEEVEIHEGIYRAWGERGYFDLERGRAELFGERVRIASDQGDLVAPHVVYTRDGGFLHADGGVQALFRSGGQSPLSGSPLGASGPVRVEAEEAFQHEQPPSSVFRGQVRAWQGDNVLFAEQLRGEQAAQRMAASGGVRTLWHPESGPEGKPAEPVEVTAESLSYQGEEHLLTYSGAVHLAQGRRVLTCEELEVDLDERQQARSMTGRRQVVLEDPDGGRTATGDTAVYDLAQRTITLTGAPVTLKDRGGNQVTGKRLYYDLATGTARVFAGEEEEIEPGRGAE